MLSTKVRLLLDASLQHILRCSAGHLAPYGTADGFLVKSFSLGLDERNQPLCLTLSLHMLPKPGRRCW